MTSIQANEAMIESHQRFFTAASSNDAVNVLKILDQGIDIEVRNQDGATALLIATHNNAVAAARILIDAGADVNAMNHIQDSPYLYAGAEGKLEILKMTLEHGADLSSINRYGGTALIPAAHHGHVDTVRELLATAIDIDHVNNLGWTALIEAVILGDGKTRYIEIVGLLLAAGANPAIADREGVSALDHAIASGYKEIADLLRTAESGNQQ